MPNIRDLRRRIRTVTNTAKITQAMEMIAASKMRRAQARALAARPYAQKMFEVLGHLASQAPQKGEDIHPLLRWREPKKLQVVLITPDRGLTGGLASNLNRRAAQFILEQKLPVTAVTVGRKGRDFMVRHGQQVRAVFTDLGDQARVQDILPIVRIMVDDYTSGQVDGVHMVYADFVSTMVQRPALQRLLPVEATPIPLGAQGQGAAPAAQAAPRGRSVEYIFEPDGLGVLAQLLPRFLEMQVYHAMLEAIASEQSARMVAMRNATDNAKEMKTDLTLEMNKVRQEMITKELLDITGGVVALEG